MKTLNVFGYTVLHAHCNNTEFYTNDDFVFGIQTVFDLAELKTRNVETPNLLLEGSGLTTEVIPYLGPANLSGSADLNNWIKQECAEFFNVDIKRIKLSASWMNKLNYGSQGRCHNHEGSETLGPDPTAVAIFYQNNPINGSDLIFIQNGEVGKYHSDYLEYEKLRLSPQTGDLVVHDPTLWHAISEHKSDEPRICLVYHIDVV
jgi:hypothetical protein